MANARNDKLFITDGTVIGRLTVGDLIRDVSSHPLYPETAQSYLKQGRLREVHCECGTVRLVAESILATGRLQSCGCLRTEIRNAARQQGIDNLKKKAEKSQCTWDIQIAQAELKRLQAVPAQNRDEKAIDEIASKLRKLFAKKALLNRKESHKDTWKNVTRKKMLDKLLEDPNADTSEA